MSGEWNYQRFFSHPPVIMFLIKECWAVVRFCYHSCDYKQLLDEIFVISRIIKVEVRVINRSRTLPRPWLFWISQKPNLTIVLLYIERKKWKSCFWFFTDGKQHKACELDMITRDLECPWHDYCMICNYDVTGADFENSLYAFGQSEKS